MRVLIAAGGTGGHIVPALAVAAALLEGRAASKSEILFVGSGKEIEKRLIGGAGYSLTVVPSVPLLGKGPKGLLTFLQSLPGTIRATEKIFNDHQPQVVLAFGGYPSMGPAVVGKLRHIPVILQEQNAQVGLANKILSLFAKRIFAVPGAKGFLRKSDVIYQPNPVRKEFGNMSMWRPPAAHEKPRLMVMGGSQGAVTLNTAVLAALPMLKSLGVEIFHQCGEVDFERVSAAYRDAGYSDATIVPFTDKILEQYQRAHLIIARAGAMSVWEISAAGRPAIFVPLRIARGHQSANAKHLVEKGAALCIEQDPGFEAVLGRELERLFKSPEALGRMSVLMREAGKAGSVSPAEVIVRAAVALGS